jgi:hypothetical protein
VGALVRAPVGGKNRVFKEGAGERVEELGLVPADLEEESLECHRDSCL